MNKQKTKAFTLVELIVVITILAILGTIAFMALQGYSKDARDSARISDMGSMKSSLELFQIEAGKYPEPSNQTIITYSGATAWIQGAFGETVYKNVSKLDKIPKDPLIDKEYVYSVTNTRNEFQLAGAMEGDEVSYKPPLTPPYQGGGLATETLSPLTRGELRGVLLGEQAQAAEKTARLKISGTYNGKLLKVSTGTTTYVLAVPSLITSSGTTLELISTNNFLAYNGYKNLPFQYNGSYKTTPETNLNLVNSGSIEVFAGNLSLLSDSTNDGIIARLQMLQKLQQAYSGTTLSNIGEISQILNANMNDAVLVESLSRNIVRNDLGGSIKATTITVVYNNCLSGSLNGYTYGLLNHSHSQNVTKTQSISNGSINNGGDAVCTNGTVNIVNETTNIVCNGGYVEQGGACILDVCNSTVPSNAHSTATSQTASQTWMHNTTPGVCTFVCDTNYTWNSGTSSCTANTQVTACSGKPVNTIWNTASSITQTWTGTNWLPNESGVYNTTSSTTNCRYICDNGYHTEDSGVSCISDTRLCTITNGVGIQTWTTSWGVCNVDSCNSEFYQSGNTCIAYVNGACNSLPSNAVYYNLTTSYSLVNALNGTSLTASYNVSPTSNTCQYKCASGYNWNGSSCILNIVNVVADGTSIKPRAQVGVGVSTACTRLCSNQGLSYLSGTIGSANNKGMEYCVYSDGHVEGCNNIGGWQSYQLSCSCN